MKTRTHTELAAVPACPQATVRAVIRDGVAAFLKLLRVWRNRREVMRLEDFTDRQLADIGLTRRDLDLSLATPWHDDPSVRLAEKARASRIVPFAEKL